MIILRPWNINDIKELCKLCNRVNRTFLTNGLPDPYTEENANWWINKVNEEEGKTGIYRAIVVDNEVVGNITIEKKTDVFAIDAELGYMLLDEYSGKGIMSEAIKLICRIAFKDLEIVRISARVFELNVASSKILVKNGFILEGTLRHGIFKNHQFQDLKLYGILKNNE